MRKRTLIICVLLGLVSMCVLAGFGARALWGSVVKDSSLVRALYRASPISEEQLEEWGDDAVVELRKVANSVKASSINYWTYEYLLRDGSRDSEEFILEILAGKTSVDPGGALRELHTAGMTTNTSLGIFIRPEFKPAVLALQDAETSFTRSAVVAYCEKLRWHDSVSLLYEMARDSDFGVREDAADALLELTGERVEIERPKLNFPNTALRENLLSNHQLVHTVRGAGEREIAFLNWFGGKPTRALLTSEELFRVSPSGERLAQLAVEHHASMSLSAPRENGETQVLVVNRHGNQLISYGFDGAKLWSSACDHENLAPLYAAGGQFGIAVGARGPELMAIDLNGQELWSVENSYVVYGLCTHPELPNLLLSVNGSELNVFRVSLEKAELLREHDPANLYFHTGTLIPDEAGEPLLIAEGSRQRDRVPVLMAFDSKGRQKWSSEMPAGVELLLNLEPEGSAKMIAAVTDHGGVYVFDASGTLLFAELIPGSNTNESFSVFDGSAGIESNGEWTLAIDTNQGFHLYTVNP